MEIETVPSSDCSTNCTALSYNKISTVYKSKHYYWCASNESMVLVHAKALPFADGSSRLDSQHAAAADCVHSSNFSAERLYADYRTDAHCPVCVDSRTKTLRTRKTTRLLAAPNDARRQPQRSQ